jgi:hypothetical protein
MGQPAATFKIAAAHVAHVGHWIVIAHVEQFTALFCHQADMSS